MDVATNKSNKFTFRYFFDFLSKIFLYSVMLVFIFIGSMLILYTIDAVKNIKSKTPQQPLFSAYVVVTPSMVPTIKVQDAIIVKRKSVDELNVGDIITFSSTDTRYSGLTVTHRIVSKTISKSGKVLFRTKGDANNTDDNALVSEDNLYGKVILTIPKLGFLQNILTQFYGWLLFIIIPSLLILLYDLYKLIKSIKKKKKINKVIEKEKSDDIDII